MVLMAKEVNLIHIYAQPWEHTEAYIVASPDGLSVLRAAIDAALDGGIGLVAHAWVADGEGYDVVVLRIDDPPWEGLWPLLMTPYRDYETVGCPDPNAVQPGEIALWMKVTTDG